jgi:hypothetical protein
MRLAYIAVGFASLVLANGLARATALSEQRGPGAAVKKVRIVVAEAESHRAQCKGGKYEPVDILVDANTMNNTPSHCVNGTLHSHGDAHKYETTIVQLSYKGKDSVLWYSDIPFAITSIAPHDDKNAATAPKNPFVKPLPTTPSTTIASGPIIQAAISHRYKIKLRINGRDIDPDLWCNP